MRPSRSFCKFLTVICDGDDFSFFLFFVEYLSIKMHEKEVGILYTFSFVILKLRVIVNFDGNLIQVSTWFHFKWGYFLE